MKPDETVCVPKQLAQALIDAEAAVVAARAACEAHQHYRDALLSGAVGALREAGHARRLATRALIRHLVEVMA